MNKSNLLEVKGSTIREITGTVISLWPRKGGTNERGTWSLQNGKLKLADGGELVNLCFSGHEDMKHLVKLIGNCFWGPNHACAGGLNIR